MVAWGQAWEGGVTANRPEISFLGDGNALKLDYGDGYRTLSLF